MDSDALIKRIPAEKDVDGLTTANAGLLPQGRPGSSRSRRAGVLTLLEEYDVPQAVWVDTRELTSTGTVR